MNAGETDILFKFMWSMNIYWISTAFQALERQEKQKGKFHLPKALQIYGDVDMDAQCENGITEAQRGLGVTRSWSGLLKQEVPEEVTPSLTEGTFHEAGHFVWRTHCCFLNVCYNACHKVGTW